MIVALKMIENIVAYSEHSEQSKAQANKCGLF